MFVIRRSVAICWISLCGATIPSTYAQQQAENNNVAKHEAAQGQDQLVAEFAKVLNQRGLPPIDYVVSKFSDHDIVLLGEVHQIKENCEFVASLIEPLNKRGVKRLCSEFTPSRYNDELRKIVTAKVYDSEAVINLFRRGPWPTWGYREYMEIIKTAWRVNQSLAEGEPPFLIVGIDSDWSQVKQFKMNRPQRFKMLLERERHMTDLIHQTAIEANQKTLVHIGFAHTVRHGIRVANELHKKHAEKMFQVILHTELSTPAGISKITTVIEKAVSASKKRQVGFDVTSSPVANLEDQAIPYVKRFGALTEGYIFLKPTSELTQTTWVRGFINEENFQDALYLSKKFRWIKDKDPENAGQLDAILAARFGSD